MDILSIVLAALGWQKEHSAKASERRIEAYRLVSEVSVEAARCSAILAARMPSILNRVRLYCPQEPAIFESCSATLMTMKQQADALHAMAESYKPTIENANAWVDWDKALMRLHEWRATVSALCPHTEATLGRYEEILRAAESEHPAIPTPPPKRKADRGFDAPPL